MRLLIIEKSKYIKLFSLYRNTEIKPRIIDYNLHISLLLRQLLAAVIVLTF